MINSIALLPEHKKQWQFINKSIEKNMLPHTILAVGSEWCRIPQFIRRLTAMVFCTFDAAEPCQQCQNCMLIEQSSHPDMSWLKPEKTSTTLKIDQIRQLQTKCYETPKLANSQFFIIEDAELMNTAAANALLKILEEPSQYTYFILITKQLNTLLPTITSRCQLISFQYNWDYTQSYLHLPSHYPQDSGPGMMEEHIPNILEDLIAMYEKNKLPTQIANQWQNFEIKNILWILYLIFAQLIRLLMQKKEAKGSYANHLNRLLAVVHPHMLFAQLDKIILIQDQLGQNINLNQNLALEELLIGLNLKNNEAS